VTEPSVPFVRGAQLDHVALAVHDAAETARLFRDVLGAEFAGHGDNHDQGFRFVHYRFPNGGKVELVTPLGDGFVSRFLERRGEGVHHMTFTVKDLRSQVERMLEGGVELIMVDADNPHWREAFIHPRNAHGVLIQVAESMHSEEDSARHFLERFPQAVELGLT
jgi:methylmalonyl-CoA/ethylmalonyl-CoA epimerase